MTTLLAIETTTQSCSAALLHAGVVCEQFKVAPRQHTDLILPMIEALLTKRTLNKSQLQAIALSAGPGSFMGTRLAYGVAQGLAYALGIPVIPVSTLQILAQSAYEEHGCEQVISGWDARMGEVYWGVYSLENGLMQPQQPDRLSKPEEVVFEPDKQLVGNSWPLYWQRDYIDCYPHAASLLTLAKPLFDAEKVLSPMEIEPVYLREGIV
jgi:tRNA threonylcarbamoyladenosine biosynthesis protein TsaB